MGSIGFGYGSEYQLMRFLGRHRKRFNQKILEVISMSGDIVWFDFVKKGLMDKEVMNMNFFNDKNITKEWNEVWATNNNKHGINWDAVGKIGDTYLLVEAKAHEKELQQPIGAKDPKSVAKINKAFQDLCSKYKLIYNDNWVKRHYQLANHLVALEFLNSRGIKALLLNVFFINGYEIDAHGKKLSRDLSVKSENQWKEIVEKEHASLGITDNKIEEKVFNIYVES